MVKKCRRGKQHFDALFQQFGSKQFLGKDSNDVAYDEGEMNGEVFITPPPDLAFLIWSKQFYPIIRDNLMEQPRNNSHPDASVLRANNVYKTQVSWKKGHSPKNWLRSLAGRRNESYTLSLLDDILLNTRGGVQTGKTEESARKMTKTTSRAMMVAECYSSWIGCEECAIVGRKMFVRPKI